jgi:hypothetical protein
MGPNGLKCPRCGKSRQELEMALSVQPKVNYNTDNTTLACQLCTKTVDKKEHLFTCEKCGKVVCATCCFHKGNKIVCETCVVSALDDVKPKSKFNWKKYIYPVVVPALPYWILLTIVLIFGPILSTPCLCEKSNFVPCQDNPVGTIHDPISKNVLVFFIVTSVLSYCVSKQVQISFSGYYNDFDGFKMRKTWTWNDKRDVLIMSMIPIFSQLRLGIYSVALLFFYVMFPLNKYMTNKYKDKECDW